MALQQMKEIEKRRDQFRLEIRRQDISIKMSAKRQEILDSYYARSFDQAIKCMLDFDEPIQVIVSYMLQQFYTCPDSVLPYLTQLIVVFLGKNYKLFDLKQNQANELIQLLFMIWRFIPDELKPFLARINFIFPIFNQLVTDLSNNCEDGGILFEIACELSVLQATTTIQKHNSFLGEIELYLSIALPRNNKLSYQILLLTMITSPTQSLNKKSKIKLLRLARQIFHRIQSGHYYQNYENLLLLQIGRHCCYQDIDRELVAYLLQTIHEKHIVVALRFVSNQVFHENWITYQMISSFMKKCSLFISEVQDIETFLRILYNVLVNEYNTPESAQVVYIAFFKDRLHHFLRDRLINELVNLLAIFIYCKSVKCQNQLSKTILACLQKRDRLIDAKVRAKLLFHLLMKNEITVASIYSYCNSNDYEVYQFWEHYKQSGVNNQYIQE